MSTFNLLIALQYEYKCEALIGSCVHVTFDIKFRIHYECSECAGRYSFFSSYLAGADVTGGLMFSNWQSLLRIKRISVIG